MNDKDKGELWLLHGPEGSGKTTLAQATVLAAVSRNREARIFDWPDTPKRVIAAALRNDCLVIVCTIDDPQTFPIKPRKTIYMPARMGRQR